MTEVAIRVENLSKRYCIGQRERYWTLRDTLTDSLSAPFRALATAVRRRPTAASFSDGGLPSAVGDRDNFIWALKDVSFEIERGEVVGIIGRNGAGKSTLLKILSRITEPTEGIAEIWGRVGSLLEVGTGFHPELTGRENIYLNGAILGMKKAEIERKFDEIVAFAEVEKFIDTPVKHYSSGMHVRLAFAVAAHLEPDILLVDEVLAVGDAAFQNKCLARIRGLTQQGITTLFVSHNMHLIEIISQTCLYLDRGAVRYFSGAPQAIELYLREIQISDHASTSSELRQGLSTGDEGRACKIASVKALSRSGSNEIEPDEDLIVTIQYGFAIPRSTAHFNVSLWSESGLLITSADSRMGGLDGFRPQAEGEIICRFPTPPLISGKYSVRVYLLSDLDWPLASFGWGDGRFCWFSVKPMVANMITGMNWFITQSDYGVVKIPSVWEF